jgi:glutamine amidotransferase
MCRHLAYLGPPVPLAELLLDPPFGLLRQSWAPRRQRHGTVNADGFGVGWYADGDPVPARYRSDRPIWTDANLPDLARVVRSGAVLGAVRSGTEGMPYGEAAAAPFAAGRYLFSHNGVLPGWPGAAAGLAATLPPGDLLGLEAATDSALLWALIRQRLGAGLPLAQALTEVVLLVTSRGNAAGPHGGGEPPAAARPRLNLLVTDGQAIAATAWGDTLWWRAGPGAVLVASEPSDDGPGWHEVPDRSTLTATPGGVAVEPLAAVPDPAPAGNGRVPAPRIAPQRTEHP